MFAEGSKKYLKYLIEMKNDLVGLLFIPSGGKTHSTSSAFLNGLGLMEHRSGQSIGFICPGYASKSSGYYGHRELPEGYHFKKASIDSFESAKENRSYASGIIETWYYSDKLFNSFVCDIEKKSNWHYNGGTQLLLLKYEQDVPFNENADIIDLLKYNAVIDIDFEKGFEKKFVSKENPFEILYKIINSINEDDNTPDEEMEAIRNEIKESHWFSAIVKDALPMFINIGVGFVKYVVTNQWTAGLSKSKAGFNNTICEIEKYNFFSFKDYSK